MIKRVVITGMGAISPLGIGIDSLWQGLIAGKSGIDWVTGFDPEAYPTKVAGEATEFKPNDYLDRKEARRMDRFTQFGVAGSKMAIEDSGINLEEVDLDRFAVVIGSGIGGIDTFEKQTRNLIEKGPNRVSPFFVPMMIANMAAGQIAIAFGLRGPNVTTVSACASSANAVGEAFELLKRGDADAVITGGTEAPVTPLAFAGFCAMKAMSTETENPQKASRPFDAERNGFVMGEGAGILVLETLEHAQKRGAKIYAEVVGYGTTSDAYHITAPDPVGKGAAKAMEVAIKDAGLKPEEVDYINAHGTSTPLGDQGETMAIKHVFGEHAYKLAVSSTKSMIGHLLGAAGGMETIICALAIKNKIVPPTINYENSDPECDLNYVPNKAVERPVKVAMTNSFGFGGHNATVVLKEFEE